MKSRQVVLQLVPGRIDVVAYDGRRMLDARRLTIDVEDEPAEWAGTVRRSAVSLRTLVTEMKVAGWPARVLYRSPTHAVDLSSYAVRSAAQACEASVMSCTDSLPYSALSAVIETAVVGRDASGQSRQIHIAAVADREDIAEAIAYLVEEAGLALASTTPMDAALMAGILADELGGRLHRGTLYIGEQTSFFVVTRKGRLLFSRRIDLGLESLAASLTRPIMISGRADSIELTIDEARIALFEHGIPERDTLVNRDHGLTGSQVVPLMQPVLQRFVVELRQSLRFGLAEGDRTNLAVRVTGPGSDLRGLPALIGTELGVEAERDSTRTGARPWWEPGADAGEVGDALRASETLGRLNLLPRAIAVRRRTSRLRRWALTGTATALALIVFDGVRFHARVQAAQLQADVYAAQIEDLAALEATGAKLAVVVAAKNELQRRIAEEVGSLVDYRACLQEMTRITPRTIRFNTMKFDHGADETKGTVSGFAFESDPGTGKTDLEPFIESLQASPLFDDVVLGNVQIGTAGNREGQQFHATFRPITVSSAVRRLEKSVVSAAEGASP